MASRIRFLDGLRGKRKKCELIWTLDFLGERSSAILLTAHELILTLENFQDLGWDKSFLTHSRGLKKKTLWSENLSHLRQSQTIGLKQVSFTAQTEELLCYICSLSVLQYEWNWNTLRWGFYAVLDFSLQVRLHRVAICCWGKSCNLHII